MLPSYVWYQDMADFAGTISDEAVGRRLARAIHGKGANVSADELRAMLDRFPESHPRDSSLAAGLCRTVVGWSESRGASLVTPAGASEFGP